MKLKEDQNTEFKESFQEASMKTFCAFANTDGGMLYLGVDDKGNVKGIENAKGLLEEVPNKINTILGITADIRLKKEHGFINRSKYEELVGIGKSVAYTDLQDLFDKKILERIGATGRGTKYVLKKQNVRKTSETSDKEVGAAKLVNVRKTSETSENKVNKKGTLDKKLLLLEKELNTIDPDKTQKEEFTEKYLFKVLGTWLGDLIKELVPVGQKFNRFFKQVEHHIYIVSGKGQVKFTTENTEEIIKSLISDCKKNRANFRNDAKVELSFLYRKLKKEGLKPIVISQELIIEFTEVHYKIYMDEFANGDKKQRTQQFDERLLHKGLTKAEIKTLEVKLGNSLFEQLDFYTKKNGMREGK
jgi:hypothetical protein